MGRCMGGERFPVGQYATKVTSRKGVPNQNLRIGSRHGSTTVRSPSVTLTEVRS